MIRTTILGTVPIDFVLGVCEPCQRPVRAQDPTDGRYITISCPDCRAPLIAERLIATQSREECGGSCACAYRPSCACACGGVFHGRLFDAEATNTELSTGLVQYRRRVRTVEGRATHRFDQWAHHHDDVVTALTGPGARLDSIFLQSMARLLNGDPPTALTDNQTHVVRIEMTRRGHWPDPVLDEEHGQPPAPITHNRRGIP